MATIHQQLENNTQASCSKKSITPYDDDIVHSIQIKQQYEKYIVKYCSFSLKEECYKYGHTVFSLSCKNMYMKCLNDMKIEQNSKN